MVHHQKARPYKGFSIACYMLGYGVIRFFIEYVRQPDKGLGFGGYGYPITFVHLDNFVSQFTWFNFTTGQILNVLLIAAAVILMAVFSARARRGRRARGAAPNGPKAPQEGEVVRFARSHWQLRDRDRRGRLP